MAAETLREFLVALGYKIDGNSERKFTTSLANTAKSAAKVGLAIEAMAAAIKAAVIVSANSLEQLYYASRRTGASAENIRAFAAAVSRMGGSADGARASMEAFGRFLRTNPAAESFIRSLGVGTRDANGRLRDTSRILQDLGRRLRAMPYPVAYQYAQVLGIDERTLDALMQGTERFSDRYREMARAMGVDLNGAAQASTGLMNKFRDLGDILELIWLKVSQEMMRNGLAKQFDDFNAFLIAHSGEIAAMIEKIIAAVLWLSEKLIEFGLRAVPYVERFVEWCDKAVTATVGWENALKGLAAVLAGGALLSLLGRLRGLLVGIAAITPPAWLLTFLGLTLMPSGGNSEAEDLERRRRGEAIPPGPVPMRPDGTPEPNRGGWWERTARPWLQRHGWQFRNEAAPGGVEGNRRGEAIDFFRMMGWSRDAAMGIAANLQTESHFDPQAVGDGGRSFGIGQWNGDRLVRLGEFIARQRGVATADPRSASFREQLQYIQHELTEGRDFGARRAGGLLRNVANAAEAGAVFSRHFERPGTTEAARDMEAANRANLAGRLAQTEPGGVTLNQRTEIVINGSGDPAAAGRTAAAEQGRVNADAARTLRSAVR